MAELLGSRPVVLLLGPMRLKTGDVTHNIRGAKQRILLAHLVLAEGRPVPTRLLISDLWAGAPPRNATHALQEHVSRLRVALNTPVELLDGAGYHLATSAVDSDVRAFTELHDLGQRQLTQGDAHSALTTFDKAHSLWRGPLLDSLSDLDGLRSQKLQLEEMRRNVASHRIDAYIACGRGAAVTADIRTALDRDPLREHSWYQLVQALDQAGRRTEALQAFHDARELFIDVLGVEPSAHLINLHTALLQATAATPLPSPGQSPVTDHGPLASASAFVGRDYELSVLNRAWQLSGEGLRVVTISGEPGVGKTRLATEFARRASTQGALVLRGYCQQNATTAYEPFADVLRATIDHASAPTAASSMPRHAPGLIRVVPEMHTLFSGDSNRDRETGSGTEDVRSMDAIAAWCEALSATQPLVIVLEDLHWADEQSLLVLQHLMQSTRTIKATVVVTIRDSHLATSATTPAPLLTLIEQSERLDHVPLTNLGTSETTALITLETQLAHAQALPTWASSYIQTASGGNPLYIIELTRHLLTADSLDSQQHPPPPAGLRQIIKDHLRTLPEHAWGLLRHAAAIGIEFDPAFLATATGTSHAEVDAMLQPALRARVIEQQPHPTLRYAFNHDVVREVLYESIPPLERAQVHTQIARALADTDVATTPNHLQNLAHHERLSDQPDGPLKAARNLKDAGYKTLEIGAPAEAGALFSQALELLDETADAGVRCDILVGLGSAQLRYADPEYRVTLLRAARLAQDLGDASRLVTAVLMNSRGWWSSSTQIDYDRIEAIEAALAVCDPTDRSAMSQLLASWAQENVRDPGSRQQVLDRSAQALEIAQELGDPDVLHTVLTSRFSVLYALFENPNEYIELSQRAVTIGQERGNRMMVLSGLLCLAQASMHFGDYQVADRSMERAEQLAQTLQHPPRLWLVTGWLAMREATRGNFDAAHALANRTFELGTQTGQTDAPTWHMGQVFMFTMMQGQLAQIVGQLDEHVAQVAAAIPAWRAAMAVALTSSGRSAEAEAILEQFVAGDFEQLPRDILWLHGMSFMSMACVALGRVDVAGALYERLAPYSGMVATNGTIDAGPVDLHLGGLARLMGDEQVAAYHLHAAANLSRTIGASVWLAQAQSQLALGSSTGVSGL